MVTFFYITFCLLFVGIRASQSLIDLSDTLIIFGVVSLAFSKKLTTLIPLPKKAILFFVFWWLGVVFSYHENFSLFQSRSIQGIYEFRWIISFVCFYYALQMMKPEHIDKILVYVLGLSFLVDIFLFLSGSESRMFGAVGSPMALAQTVSPLLVYVTHLLIYELVHKRNFSTNYLWITILTVTSGAYTLFMTQTRGAIAAFAVSLLFTFFWLEKKWRLLALSSSTILIAGVILLSPALKTRLQQIGSQQDFSTVSRSLFWKANTELFLESPILGKGFGVNNYLFFDRLTADERALLMEDPGLKTTHAHNQYLQFAAGTGLWGLVCYLLFLGSLIFFVFSSLKGAQDHNTSYFARLVGLWGALLCFALNGATEANFSIAKDRITFLFLAAYALVLTFKGPDRPNHVS